MLALDAVGMGSDSSSTCGFNPLTPQSWLCSSTSVSSTGLGLFREIWWGSFGKTELWHN